MKCFEAKIEESEEATTELLQPDIAQVVLLNGSVSQHSVCAIRTPLGVDRKSSPSGENPF